MRNNSLIAYDTDFIRGISDKYDHIKEMSVKFSLVYEDIKNEIIQRSYITKQISRGDLIFLKTFIEEYPILLDDFEITFGKYLK